VFFKIFNLGCGKSTTLIDLGELLYAKIKPDYKEIIYSDARQGEPRFSCADISNAVEQFGYNAFIDLDEGLSLTLDKSPPQGLW
jgi:nucleoside-diphosphate-sugar epimerase